MTAKKASLPEATTKLYEILEPFESSDRQKAMNAVLTLLGESALPSTPPSGSTSDEGGKDLHQPPSGSPGTIDAKPFFDEKDPHNKGEELVVAGRYRELYEDAHTHTRDELKKVIRSARRNFDSSNFYRDLNNAKIKGLFNKGDGNPLSYYGQQYVDALPDRDAVKKIRKPKAAGRKKAASKRKKKKN